MPQDPLRSPFTASPSDEFPKPESIYIVHTKPRGDGVHGMSSNARTLATRDYDSFAGKKWV